MRLMVVSDTHGMVNQAMEIYRREEEKAHIDHIIHLGDLKSDARALQVRLGADVICVPGNCDGSISRDDEKVVETPWGKILLTHGHLESVDYDLQKLQWRAEEMGCKAAFFGHTHRPTYVFEHGMYFLNPGSLSRPRGVTEGSYAMVEVTEDGFVASILYYSPKPKVTSGVLYDMLNNSDRF
ncbi:MAG: metallophosphoesterase [Firmicutes bacterium]|nr:metallophosphoesterase [Bacillota bacterium]MBQ6684826.1 metallophosphoesterase [Bacillota bacterium]